ncbi:hypothetical protein EVA_05691 [gut metagenome]|uniref:Uncharacterized protein n=1 Tax=gut metagenome TaxID=749906 RepID=J9D0W5_9ZZZZ
MEYISSIITAIGVIIIAWFKYNQDTKNKETDLKIEKFRREQEAKAKRRSDNCSIVYGELWNILHELNADRVYIIQPHPLGNESSLSVYFEVKRKGVEGMQPHIHKLKISEVAKFSSELVKNLFMYITDIDEQVKDKYAKSILSSYGSQMAIVKRLNDNSHDWIGSIFCEFTHPISVSEEEAREIMHTAALNIQYLLPEYKE